MINFTCFQVGMLPTNCYVLEDEKTKTYSVVDPGGKSDELVNFLKNKKVEYILLTHGHYDHIAYLKELKENTGAKVVIGEKEKAFLYDGELNLSIKHFGVPFDSVKPDILLNDGDTITFGETVIRLMETPGHTGGSGCYIVDEAILSGDTLFRRSIGRTDFSTGSIFDMYNSLRKLNGLENDYLVLPGHGPATKLLFEKENNPYMREALNEDIY